jgi:Fur family ferric uptake transcriptional regulator
MMAPDIQQNVQRIFSDYLEKQGHRKTPERFAIHTEIYTQDGHFDIERLYVRMKRKKYRVSRATLYNTMDLLLDCSLVRKHQFGSTHAQFERAHSFRQHDHVICTGCDKVLEFCDPRIQNIRSTIAEVMGFEVSSHALHIYGLCPDCLKARDKK